MASPLMSGTRSRVTGLRETSEALRRLPGHLSEQVMVKALRAGARPIVKAARQRAPFPEMRRAIKVRKAGRRARGWGTLIRIGIEKPVSSLAHLFEFGTGPRIQKTTGRATGRISAQPFLRPAIDEAGPQAIRIIGKRLGLEIAKAAEQEAAKIRLPGFGGGRRRGRRR